MGDEAIGAWCEWGSEGGCYTPKKGMMWLTSRVSPKDDESANASLRSIGEKVKRKHDKDLSLDLILMGEELHPLSEVSEWVLQKMGEVSQVVEFSFEGFEQEVWELFSKLERRELHRNSGKEPRELRNLKWRLSYNKGEREQSRGSERKVCRYKGMAR